MPSYENANVDMFVFPRMMAPACRSSFTLGASSGAMMTLQPSMPSVVANPLTAYESFTTTGTPCSGPSTTPDARRRSDSAASASAAGFTITAFSFAPASSCLAIRCR